MIEFLILLLLIKYRHSLGDLFSSPEPEYEFKLFDGIEVERKKLHAVK